MICSNCTASLNESYTFCPQCGVEVISNTDEYEKKSQTNEQSIPYETDNTPFAEQPSEENVQKAAPPYFGYENPIYNNIQEEQPVYPDFSANQFIQPNYIHIARDPGRDFAIVSLVLGIVSYLLLCSFFFGWPGTFATTITGIVLGAKSIKKSKQVGITNGMAICGIITSSIALAFVTGICLLYLALFITGMEMAGTEFMNELI